MIKGIKSVFPPAFLLLMMQLAYLGAQSTRGAIQGLTNWPLVENLTAAIAVFFISALPVILIETLWPRERQEPNWLLASSIWIVTISFRVLVVLGVFRLVSDYIPGPLFRLNIPDQYRALAMPFVFFGYKVLLDFFNYWHHRAQHRIAFLWRFHKVHHSTRDLNSLNSVHHFLVEVVLLAMVTIPMAVLLKANLHDAIIFVAIFSSWNRFIHANTTVNLGSGRIFLTDPVYHRVHHSRDPAHYNKNFASTFPFIDMIFGTHLKPGTEALTVGLTNDPEPSSIRDHFMMPFRPKNRSLLGSDDIRAMSNYPAVSRNFADSKTA